jgi:hypothetical protein
MVLGVLALSFAHVWNLLFRMSIGAMWWQAALWKLPPDYTDEPGQPFGKTGLASWIIRLGKTAALQLQADFVNNIVLPHFYPFAPIVFGLEVLTAASLIPGLFVRFWGVCRGAAGAQSVSSASITTITTGHGHISS